MQNEKCGIYLITERATGRGYVGLTTRKFTDRWCEHEDRFPLQLFDYEILLPLPFGTEAKELKKLERFYIAELDTMSPNGFNETRGGNGSGPCSPETKKRKSESEKKRWDSKSSKEKLQWSSYIRDRIADSIAVMSEEEKRQHSENRSIAAKNRESSKTPEERHVSNMKNSETNRTREFSMSIEEKQQRSKKLSESNKNRYSSENLEQKQTRIEAAKAREKSKTPEQKFQHSYAIRAQKASKNIEQKKIASENISTAAKNRECSMSEEKKQNRAKKCSEASKEYQARKRAAKAAAIAALEALLTLEDIFPQSEETSFPSPAA
jgi:hypothetical protein